MAPRSDTKQAAGAIGPPTSPPFLRFAREQPFPVQVGTLGAGDAGGVATSFLTWNPGQIPEVPAWCSKLDFNITLPVAIVVPAGATVRMSPYAPYSAFSMQMLLAGSPEWPSNMSLVPFWLDEIISRGNFDPMGIGPNIIAGAAGNPLDVPQWFDKGILPPTFAGAGTTLLPGASLTNGGGGPVTYQIKIQFQVRVRFQRKHSQMWGMVPLGDPANRPQLKLQLNSLVGPNPENALLQDVAAAGITATVGAGGILVDAIFRSKSLDILPASVPTLAQPAVGLGLNVTYDNSFQIQNAGAILYQYQRTAQIYTALHHLFVNNQQAIDPDYFGLWLTQNKQSARWEYDNSAGSMQDYYLSVLERYRRYLPKGHMLADLEGGQVPEMPNLTPYVGLMSPDVAYAAAAGVAATPNMCTAFRIPAGTSMVGAYAAIYSFGLVRVPY